MDRTPLERLQDARDLASWFVEHISGLSPGELARERRDLLAALHGLVIVGEALGKVPDELKSLAPEIPWRAIAGMRNQIVHSYWQLDLEVVAAVIATRLKPLVEELEGLIALVGETDA